MDEHEKRLAELRAAAKAAAAEWIAADAGLDAAAVVWKDADAKLHAANVALAEEVRRDMR